MHKPNHVLLLLTSTAMLSGCFMSTNLQVASHLFKKARGQGSVCNASQEGHLKVGNPYRINGVKYYPKKSSYSYAEEGIASWYGADFHGKDTANGECYDMYAMTAAHKTLPLPTTVRVTNLENGRSVILRVNDRGPYAKGRIIDLSYAAARALKLDKQGVGPVRVEAIGGPHHKPGGFKGSQTQMAKTKTHINDGFTNRVTQNSPRASMARQYQPKAVEPSQPPQAKPGGFTSRITQAEELKSAPSSTSMLKAAQPKAETLQQAQSPTPVVREDLPPPPENVPETSTKMLHQVQLYVQTGAFGSLTNAQKQLAKVKKYTGNSTHIMEHNSGGRTLHRVRSGPYNSIADADTILAELVDAGFNTAVIAVEK